MSGLLVSLAGCADRGESRRFGEGPPRRVTSAVEVTEGSDLLAALSPDGTRVALLILGQPWVLERDEGEAASLLDPADPPTEYWGLTWSPDSRRLAGWFWEGDPERRGLRIFDLPSDSSFVLREARDLVGLGWTSGGNALFYASVEGDSTVLWRRDPAADSARVMGSLQERVAGAALSPGADRVAYVLEEASSGRSGLWEMQLASGSSQLVVSDSLSPSRPSYSPDGSRIAFHASRDGQRGPWIVDRSTGSRRALAREVEDVHDAPITWSSTGDTVLFTAMGRPHLAAASADGAPRAVDFTATHRVGRWIGLRRPELRAPGEEHAALGVVTPDLSPGGDAVVFSALGDLWVTGIDAEKTRQLTRTDVEELRPRWSPDGSRIAHFVMPPRGESEIAIVDSEGAGSTRRIPVPHTVNYSLDLAWRPDGARLAFAATDVTSNTFYVGLVDPATEEVRTLVEGRGFPPDLIGWSAEPTGLVFSRPVWDRGAGRYTQRIRRLDTGTAEVEPWLAPDTLALRSGWTSDLDRAAYSVAGKGYWRSTPDDAESNPVPDPAPRDFSWSADGTSLLYMSGPRLRLLDVASNTARTVPVDVTYDVPPPSSPLLLRNVRVIDGTGTPPTGEVNVSIESGRIASIGSEDREVEPGVEVVDARGLTVLPGMINLHVHLGPAQRPGSAFPYFGTTTVRDVGTEAHWMRAQVERIRSGGVVGPRVFFAGGMIEHESGHGVPDRPAVDREDPRTVRHLVESFAGLGASVIKIRIRDPQLDRMVADAAHESGLPVTSHYLYPATIATGLDGKEHAELYYRESVTAHYRRDALALAEAGNTCVTSTLMAGRHAALLLGDDDLDLGFPEGTLSTLEPFFSEEALQLLRRPIPPEPARMLHEQLEINLENVERLRKRDIPVTAATDAGPLDVRLDLELGLLVQAGLTPLQAIRAATLEPARCLGVDHELGTVTEGKRADLVLVRGDPSRDITNLREIEYVILGGRLYPRSELRMGGHWIRH